MADTIEGEREQHVERQTSDIDGTKRRAMAAGLAALGVGGAFALFMLMAPARKPILEQKSRARTVAAFEPAPERPHNIQVPTAAVMTAALPAPTLPRSELPSIDPMLDSARRAPVVAFKRTMPDVPIGTPANGGTHDGIEADDKGLFERRLKPPHLGGAKAGLIGDRRFIVAQGTSIPCVLETALQSDQAGFASCVVSRDVLSDNGQVVLMEKGTAIVGEYRGGLQLGQSRLHVLWSRAKTPTGVIVELASPGTDALGRAGFGGTVDNHWWQRFGSALLLSIVGDASKAATQTMQRSTGYAAANTANAGREGAAIAVEQASHIKPTLHKNQGEVVSVFVARDLDFSGVYRLALVGDHGRYGADRTAGKSSKSLSIGRNHGGGK